MAEERGIPLSSMTLSPGYFETKPLAATLLLYPPTWKFTDNPAHLKITLKQFLLFAEQAQWISANIPLDFILGIFAEIHFTFGK